jgi:hypothetical protein
VDAALGVNIPNQDWVGEYYNNPNLANDPLLVRNEGGGYIDRVYPVGASPVPGVIGAENYSVRWTRTLTFTAGTYRFSVTGDDGVRLYIDDQLKINEWRPQSPTTFNVDVNLGAGNHDIRLEYYQASGSAEARLIWGLSNPSCLQTVAIDHWKGEYFNNEYLGGSAVMIRDEGMGSLSLNWGNGGPSSICNTFADYFSARFTRRVDLGAAMYRFTVFGDNGVRLWVDNILRVDRWTNTVGTDTVNVQLSAGPHDIKLEYFEIVGDAAVSLSWVQLPPEAPSNLAATPASPSQINLTWADNSNFEDGFRIERWNGSSFVLITTVGANVRAYNDPGLTASTIYIYRVKAFNGAGESGYSNESSASTFPPPPPPIPPGTCGGVPDYATYPSSGCVLGLTVVDGRCGRSNAFIEKCYTNGHDYDPSRCVCVN